jgi:hypothetical protein
MRLLALVLPVLALGLLFAGCGAERPEQRAARRLVEQHVRPLGEYDADDVRCTGNPRPWFVPQATNVYICAVGRGRGDCDWFRVTVREHDAQVTLEARHAGCVLPA